MKTTVENRFIWFDGKVMNVNDAKINILAPTAQFGLNVFEGIRCYYNAENKQLYGFRLDDHYKRLMRSAHLLQLDHNYTAEQMKQALIDAVRANDYHEDIAVRQTLICEGFGTWSSSSPIGMFVAPTPKSHSAAEYNKSGLKCCVSSWERINDNSLSPRIKCGANYINSRMAQREALRNGYDTAIFLNKAGKVAEGPGCCVFLIRDGILVTPMITDSVLESITRDTVLKIARDILKIPTEERTVDRTELYMCDEAFLCGSAMEVTPVISVDQYKIGNEAAGPLTTKIHEYYLKAVRGQLPGYEKWVTPIYDK
jgi:branched-chain amino acid aminotransferase